MKREELGKRLEAEEVLSRLGKDQKVRVWSMFTRMADEMSRAESMDDSELLDEVMNTVWGDLDADSHESAVLEELIHRFKEKGPCKNVMADKVS